ncbi:MAG: S-adenosylmethionine decarboxylase [Polyangiaceae bacterium]
MEIENIALNNGVVRLPLSLGMEWVVDARQCSTTALRDVATIDGVIAQILSMASLVPVSAPIVHRLPEGGIAMIVLLAEAHLAIHTFPARGAATLNLYSAHTPTDLDWRSALGSWLGAREVHVRRLARGEFS